MATLQTRVAVARVILPHLAGRWNADEHATHMALDLEASGLLSGDTPTISASVSPRDGVANNLHCVLSGSTADTIADELDRAGLLASNDRES